MDEHDKLAREVRDALQQEHPWDWPATLASALRSTAAAAERRGQDAERERALRIIERAAETQGDLASNYARNGDDREYRHAHAFDVLEALRVAIDGAAPTVAAASPAQAERVSEDGARFMDLLAAHARGAAETTSRIAARLRARADEEERDGRDVQQFTVTERAACHRASLALRSEADALEGT